MRTVVTAIILTAAGVTAAVIGTSTVAESLTAERIAALPAKDRAAWKAYLDKSAKQALADRAVLAAEVKAAGLTEPIIPGGGRGGRGMRLDQPAEWYGSADARKIADIIVSFQTPAGGWSKNMSFSDHLRKPGEHWAGNNLSHYLTPDDFDNPHDPKWNYVGTLDNNATNTQLQFLARVITQTPDVQAYRASFLRGVEYLLAAQYPNGGFPQVYPLEGGYHDAVTFNDDAVENSLAVLTGVSEGKAPFAFAPADVRKRAAAAVARGLEVILASQITENGHKTVWGQQHDPLTLKPVSGRNYEPAALCSSESASLVIYLMGLPKPSPAVVKSVTDAVAWFEKTGIHGKAYARGPEGAKLVDRPDGPTIWARYYEIGTDRPIFGDRDKTIHDKVEELSRERLNGYSWYGPGPQAAIDRFKQWKK